MLSVLGTLEILTLIAEVPSPSALTRQVDPKYVTPEHVSLLRGQLVLEISAQSLLCVCLAPGSWGGVLVEVPTRCSSSQMALLSEAYKGHG